MEYRVEELARAAGIGVDTIRFYQARRLLPPPERRGRAAFYSEAHLERLRRIRELNRQGVTLAGVQRLIGLEAEPEPGLRRSLLGALAEAEGSRSYTREELAQQSELPAFVLDSLAELGLLLPAQTGSGPRYSEPDLRSLRAGRALLSAGIPLPELLELAQRHAAHTAEVADAAIELFDHHVRQPGAGAAAPQDAAVVEAFRELLPAVSALVALHFQRTLLERARAKLEASGDAPGLAAALLATRGARLEVSWK